MNGRTAPRFLSVLIYVLPALVDMVMAQFFFINPIRLARMGASVSVVANSVTAWSVVYLVSCPVVGRFVTPSNAARMMLGAVAGLALASLLFLVTAGVWGIYAVMCVTALACAFFFPPFQVFMKAADFADNKPVAYSAAVYTAAWSLGFAFGPFVSGMLMELGSAQGGGSSGWRYACLFAAVASSLAGVGIWCLRHLVKGGSRSAGAQAGQAAGPDYSRMPDLAWLGWLAGGAGMVVLAVIRSVFPARAVGTLHMSDGVQGAIFCLLSLTQAVTGLALCRGRRWMYNPKATAAFGAAGVAGALVFGFATSPFVLCLGSLLFGVYAGGFFVYLVFHALVHPARSSRYISINEAVVGVGGIVGPMLGGLAAGRFGFATAYAAAAALIVLVVAIQWRVKRHLVVRIQIL